MSEIYLGCIGSTNTKVFFFFVFYKDTFENCVMHLLFSVIVAIVLLFILLESKNYV